MAYIQQRFTISKNSEHSQIWRQHGHIAEKRSIMLKQARAWGIARDIGDLALGLMAGFSGFTLRQRRWPVSRRVGRNRFDISGAFPGWATISETRIAPRLGMGPISKHAKQGAPVSEGAETDGTPIPRLLPMALKPKLRKALSNSMLPSGNLGFGGALQRGPRRVGDARENKDPCTRTALLW